MSESNGANVPWKWVAGVAVGLLISIGGYVINDMSNQIKDMKLSLSQLRTEAGKEKGTLLVTQNEQTHLKRRVSSLEDEAANMIERWLRNQNGNDNMNSRKIKKMRTLIQQFRSSKKRL